MYPVEKTKLMPSRSAGYWHCAHTRESLIRSYCHAGSIIRHEEHLNMTIQVFAVVVCLDVFIGTMNIMYDLFAHLSKIRDAEQMVLYHQRLNHDVGSPWWFGGSRRPMPVA